MLLPPQTIKHCMIPIAPYVPKNIPVTFATSHLNLQDKQKVLHWAL
jgi:hypothetical protein